MNSASSLASTERARSSSAMRVEASLAPRTHSSRWRRCSCIVRYEAILPSSSSRRRSASRMPRCALSRTRSADASSASSAAISGSRPRSASSTAVTAWSCCCRANKASRSGCTTPPLGYAVLREAPISLQHEALQLPHHAVLLRHGGQRQRALQLVHLPLDAPRLDPVHRPLEQAGGVAFPSPPPRACRPQLLVSAGRDLVEPLGGGLRHGLGHRAVGGGLAVLRAHPPQHPGAPGGA